MTREYLAKLEPWIATALACLLGVVLAARTFLVTFPLPLGGLVRDEHLALHAIAQRCMIADGWWWPCLPSASRPDGAASAMRH